MSHSRGQSNDSSLSTGSAYKLILEHVLSFPGSYELPLRTMYTLNCLSRNSPLPQQLSRPSTPHRSPTPSPTSNQFPDATAAQAATAQFTTSLFQQVSRLPSQPCSLPPVFINSFVRRCFPPELELVDFSQALTGLDYLKDLETRRRRECAAAFHRLGVEREQLEADREDCLKSAHPAVAKWVDDTEKSESKIEALYTQVYVALRRWVCFPSFTMDRRYANNVHRFSSMNSPPYHSINTTVSPCSTHSTHPRPNQDPPLNSHLKSSNDSATPSSDTSLPSNAVDQLSFDHSKNKTPMQETRMAGLEYDKC